MYIARSNMPEKMRSKMEPPERKGEDDAPPKPENEGGEDAPPPPEGDTE